MRIFALIPAAGKSARMGRPKLALPLGGRSVLERVVDALRAAGVSDILVILGPHVRDLTLHAEAAGATALVLPEETADMRATIEAGLTWLEANRGPQAEDAFLLTPADHPMLDSEVVRSMMKRLSIGEKSIVIPTFEGRRGHPALISWKHVAGILALPANVGLNHYLRDHEDEMALMPCSSAEILCDLDTPEDYERLVKRLR